MFILSAALSLSASASGADPAAPPAPGDPMQPGQVGEVTTIPPVEKVAPGRYRLGAVEIDKRGGTLTFPAEVNMDKGLLEYLLVHSKGKTHESLLRTKVEPYTLQLACLLLGLEGTSAPLAAQGAPERPTGEEVEIFLSSEERKSQPSEEWMINLVNGAKKPVPPMTWIFTGSMVVNGRFAAEADGSMVAVYHDPVAIIDNASKGGETDKMWYVKEGAVPPPGTPVTVVIRKVNGAYRQESSGGDVPGFGARVEERGERR
ncbi:YdjY domain-containing protein [Geomonas sp. RF6]|uniref:YdjY domain-containing protein n=1 Tax=Geomonas sp. RF6 TaxID=2897342 RepID=UPI001E5433E4|nr:YdjY domain-containing protein [Geomonas sp. RF6]UFS69557.1 YdjY domain-containing protein [Geomonas sp. RF6]